MPSAHWRRLDLPGRDTARLISTEAAHHLEGAAYFQDAGELVAITYVVTLARDWTTESAALRLMTRESRRRVRIVANRASPWTVHGRPMPAVSGCIDLDLAFTPATNLISIRRLALEVGQAADVTAAWFDFRAKTLAPLRQTYHRMSDREYAYSCPDLDFRAMLLVDDDGFVRRYPPLWEEA
jgi:uncharacterized protein